MANTKLDQSQALDQMNRYVVNTSAKNSDAMKRRADWMSWYSSLGWHARSLEPQSLEIGRQKITALVAANGSSFGAERRTLRQGMKGDDVKTMQGIVGATPADGNFGPGTKSKVVAWQRGQGLTPDGVFGPASWAKSDSGSITDADRAKVMALVAQTSTDTTQGMYENPISHAAPTSKLKPTKKDTTPSGSPMPSTAVMHPTIRQGSKGPDVTEWQRLMGLKQDGNFGPATTKKTKLFQHANHLKTDGVVGPKTWMAAYASFASTSDSPPPGAVIDSTNTLPPALAPTTSEMLAQPPATVGTVSVWSKPQGVQVAPEQIPQLIGRPQGTLGMVQGSMVNPAHWNMGEKIVGGLAVLGALFFGYKQSKAHK